MKIIFSILIPQAVSAALRSCTTPFTPLASQLTLTSNEENNTSVGKFTCQNGFIGLGSDTVICSDGILEPNTFQCTTNVALNKPTHYNSDKNMTGSVLAVDGDFYESNSEFNCDKVDKKNKVWSVDLQEEVKVIAVKIKTHEAGGVGKSIEIKVGNSLNQNENNLCWWIPKTQQGDEEVYACPDILSGRYVSISTSSLETTFFLCEVQVLSPASEQIIPSQCSFQEASQQSLKSFSIYQNNCFHLQSESKLNFSQSVDFCKQRGFDVIHNKTNDGGKSYLFAREYYQRVSKETKQRVYAWIGAQMYNDSWHWIDGEKDPMTPGPTVTHTNWGILEPDGGDCVVMDSGMGWSWNAVRCLISGHVSCQGYPVWCPSPPMSEGASVNQPDQERYPEGSEVSVSCQRGLTGDPGQSVTTRCSHGFWTDYSLVCTPAKCDKLSETESLSVVYLSNSTDFDSTVKVTVICKNEDVSLTEVLTCKEVVVNV